MSPPAPGLTLTHPHSLSHCTNQLNFIEGSFINDGFNIDSGKTPSLKNMPPFGIEVFAGGEQGSGTTLARLL